MFQFNPHQPVIIGGLGGSGTRVVAEILIKLEFYFGSDLNSASDNLWFAFLFKRPKWFFNNYKSNQSEIKSTIALFEKVMLRNKSFNASDWNKMIMAALQWSLFGNHYWGIGGSGKGIWPFHRMINILRSDRGNQQYTGWGWKEPNSHVYLEFLADHFKEMKYIHLVRHGLDMAFSKNQSQLYSWGKVHNINSQLRDQPSPDIALEYWIKANQKAISVGKKRLGKNFLQINFEKLCQDPLNEITRLIEFLKIDISTVDIKGLSAMPVLPKTAGRYKQQDLSIFTREYFKIIEELGFDIQHP